MEQTSTEGTKMAEEHKHGTMDTTAQEKTFAGFMNFTKWAIYIIIAILVLLAIFRT